MKGDGHGGEWLTRAVALRWTVKESFVGYVQGGGGSITIVEPASAGESGFDFPVIAHRGSLHVFAGGVVFQAHGGVLSVAIAEPAVARTPDGLFLTIADLRAPDADDARRPVVRLRMRHLDEEKAVLSAFLTIAGAAVFGLAYPEGLELDPVTLTLARP